ncbi:hypothetical protein [Magnetospirillum aberrantis]|uniref:Uncharacterized protein n=1 Tax=Magnetospirillum aberrantis SpK TaxID=908842 RepID=A0A7C9UW25_9PROT|nr:hypothetical protein [Magnetospirillum aberrantis]NFV81828.1 hypothetical protein [Magnetospirillum aberrantis SpK]
MFLWRSLSPVVLACVAVALTRGKPEDKPVGTTSAASAKGSEDIAKN